MKLYEVLTHVKTQSNTRVLDANSLDQIEVDKMGKAVITFKIMPEGVETDLEPIKQKAQEIVVAEGAIGETRVEEEPIAFGLKAVKVLAMYEVGDNDFDGIAAKMSELDGVQSAEVAKMDLALG